MGVRRTMGVLAVSGGLLIGSGLPASAQDGGHPLAGKAVYERHCLRCHGAGGWGDGPDARALTVPPANFHRFVTQTKSDEQLLATIEFGSALSPMHGWRGRLSDREMDDVVAYLRLLMQRGR